MVSSRRHQVQPEFPELSLEAAGVGHAVTGGQVSSSGLLAFLLSSGHGRFMSEMDFKLQGGRQEFLEQGGPCLHFSFC